MIIKNVKGVVRSGNGLNIVLIVDSVVMACNDEKYFPKGVNK